MALKNKKNKKKAAIKENDPEQLQLEARTPPPQSDSDQVPKLQKQSDSAQVPGQKQSESAQATVTTTESVKRRSGGPRSVCAMYKVVVKKALGKRMKVTYNECGVPNGSTRHTLQSYIGMLARTMVPIDIPSWPTVDNERKQKIWLDVQDTFKVSPKSEKLVLKSAGNKWRQFKSALTTKYILPFAGQKKKILARPPKQYAFVGKETWRRFVALRTGEEWLPIHKEHSERVFKRKYPHRLSRKGYIGLQEEEVKSGNYEVGEEPDRALLWKKARISKNNQVSEELAVVHHKIDMLLEKKKQGEFTPSGSNDVLSAALGTPEHSGRVRGVGGFITPTQYFNLPKGGRIRVTKAELLARDNQRTEELNKAKEEMAKSKEEMLSEIAELKAIIYKEPKQIPSPMMSSKGSIQVDKDKQADVNKSKTSAKGLLQVLNDEDCTAIDPHPPSPQKLKGPRSCELAVESIENKVAFGLVFPLDQEGMSNKIHGSPMPTGCLRVSVDGSIKPEALLPVPVTGEMEKVEDAVGSHVAWPEHLIIFPTPKTDKKELTARKKTEFQKMQNLFNQAEPSASVPKRYRLLYKHATTYMQVSGTPIQFPCDLEVFGVEKTIFVLHENLIALLKYEMIGQAIIASYMLNLHSMIREDAEMTDTFAFFYPGSAYKLDDDFERYFVDRMREGNPDRVFFLPHNHDMHWVLSIIWEGEIYILNPLPSLERYRDLEEALISSLKAFNVQTGRGSKLPKVKYLSGSPKQPGGHECGYVVMRYMKEIIEDKELTFASKWTVKTRKSYTEEQIQEVRYEALAYIEQNM